MSIDSLSVWKSEFANLPKVNDDSWKQNIADYIYNRVNGKLTLSTYSPAASFVFNKAALVSELSSVTPELQNGVAKIASGVKLGVIGGLTISPGTSFDGGTPAETFSVVTSSTFDTSALALLEAKILELEGAAAVPNAADSEFPVKIREAFLLLTATTIGLDSTPAPSGPLALTDAARSVL